MSKIFTLPHQPIQWGGSPHDFTKDPTTGEHNLQLGPHTIEEVQRYVYGTRYLTWNGQVHKYANAEGAVLSYHAASRIALASACSVYAAAPTDSQIGDRSIVWTTQGAARDEDDLAGGYAFIYDKSSGDNIRRNIVGNDASVAGTTKLHLDYPLEIAIDSAVDYLEIFENIYGDTSKGPNEHSPWLGIPNRACDAGYKYWIQTWGICVSSVGEVACSIARAAMERGIVFGAAGTLWNESDHNTGGWQQAGYHLTDGASSYGPLFMLQCST